MLRRRYKTAIAARTIRSLNPSATIVEIRKSWHDAIEALKRCDAILGAVNSFREREQLERFARRHLIPYIDVGMDVHETAAGHLVSGQVILSSPGHPCLRCCGFIADEGLTEKAGKYGAAGGRPQVVWPNAVLASTAIGLLMQTVTPWHRKPAAFAYLVYDGNRGTIVLTKLRSAGRLARIILRIRRRSSVRYPIPPRCAASGAARRAAMGKLVRDVFLADRSYGNAGVFVQPAPWFYRRSQRLWTNSVCGL